MKVVSIIPARWGSTRFEGKPLADINGKPMIQRVCERARAAKFVGGVTVATDDERIFKAVTSFGGAVVMTSADHASGTDRIAEAIKNIDADIIVNVQGDEPLIEPSAIDEAVAPMLADPALQICTLKTLITDEHEYRDTNVVKVVTDKDGLALYFSRSPIPFSRKSFSAIRAYKHIGLYVYRREFLFRFASMKPTGLETAESLEQLRALENGVRIKVVETAYNPISVDTPEDLEKVRGIFKAKARV